MLWFQTVSWDYSSCLINFHRLEKLPCGLSGRSSGAYVPLDRLGLVRGARCLMRPSCSQARCLWRLGSGTLPRRVPYRVWSGVLEGSLKGNALFCLWYSCCLVILGMPCSLFSACPYFFSRNCPSVLYFLYWLLTFSVSRTQVSFQISETVPWLIFLTDSSSLFGFGFFFFLSFFFFVLFFVFRIF